MVLNEDFSPLIWDPSLVLQADEESHVPTRTWSWESSMTWIKKTTSQTYKEVQMNSAQWLKTPVTWMTGNLQTYFYGIVLIILIMIIAQALSIKNKAGFSIQIIKMWLKRRLSSLIPWILQTQYINCLGSTTFLNV